MVEAGRRLTDGSLNFNKGIKMNLKTDSYAACQRTEPVVEDDGKYGYIRKQYIVQARGNAKNMRRLAKQSGKGWIVALTNTEVGGAVYF